MVAGPAMASSTLQVVDENGDVHIIWLQNQAPSVGKTAQKRPGTSATAANDYKPYLVDSTIQIAPPATTSPTIPPTTPPSAGGNGCSMITFGKGNGKTTGYGRMTGGHFTYCRGSDGNSR